MTVFPSSASNFFPSFQVTLWSILFFSFTSFYFRIKVIVCKIIILCHSPICIFLNECSSETCICSSFFKTKYFLCYSMIFFFPFRPKKSLGKIRICKNWWSSSRGILLCHNRKCVWNHTKLWVIFPFMLRYDVWWVVYYKFSAVIQIIL